MRMMTRYLWAIGLTVMLVQPAAAQNRPLLGSTAQTTDTTANSLLVGCALGSTTCTGGIKAGALTLSSTSATAIDVEGGITAGSGNVGIVGTDGKIPALSSAYVASLTILGNWTFTGVPAISATNPVLKYVVTGAAADNTTWIHRGVGTTFNLTLCNDAVSVCTDPLAFTRSANTLTSTVLTTNSFTLTGATTNTGIITPPTLALGDNNNYAPTGFANAKILRLTPNGSGSALTGIAGGTSGREIDICNTTSGATGIDLKSENASSTAANRILVSATSSVLYCVRLIYDGTLSRWIVFGDLK